MKKILNKTTDFLMETFIHWIYPIAIGSSLGTLAMISNFELGTYVGSAIMLFGALGGLIHVVILSLLLSPNMINLAVNTTKELITND